jgi:hypothetical protein
LPDARLAQRAAVVDPAVAAIVGAAVGGLIPAGVSFWNDSRRRAREDAREVFAAVAAARLVWNEMEEARTTLNVAINDGHWGFIRLSSDLWREHRGLLAAVLPGDEWTQVVRAAVGIEVYTHTAELGRELKDPELVDQLRDEVLGAREVLAALGQIDEGGVRDVSSPSNANASPPATA